MRVLGLDPGLTCAGFGVVDHAAGKLTMVEFGAIRTRPDPIERRLEILYDEVHAIIGRHQPDVVAVERVLFNANARTAMSVGQAAGIALLAASKGGCEVAQYTPNEVKLAVAGAGNAAKSQVQRMVARLLRLAELPAPVDAADALALAITHLHAYRLRSLTKEANTPARVHPR